MVKGRQFEVLHYFMRLRSLESSQMRSTLRFILAFIDEHSTSKQMNQSLGAKDPSPSVSWLG